MSREIQLVAVQMRLSLDDYWTQGAFRRRIDGIVRSVKRQTDPALPTLVAFPEDVGLMLVLQDLKGVLEGATTMADAVALSARALVHRAWRYRLLHRLSWVPALLMSRRRRIAETYFDVFSHAARECGAYLAAGSVALPPFPVEAGRVRWDHKPLESRVYNSAYVFDPDGRVVGVQRKVHLIEIEQGEGLDLAAGSVRDLSVLKTPLGRVGVAICFDCFQDDVAFAIARGGAQILVQPSANPAPWTDEQREEWRESAYRRTAQQRLFTYAVNPMMTGSVWELEFYGQSSIVGRSGVIRQADSDDGEEILVARVPHPDSVNIRPGP